MSKLKQFVEAVDEQLELKDTVCVPAEIAIAARNVAAGLLKGARATGKGASRIKDPTDTKAAANRERVRKYREKA